MMCEVKNNNVYEKKSLSDLEKEDLVEMVLKLQSHNKQLKNIIKKSQISHKKSFIDNQKHFDFTKCRFRHVLLRFFYLGWNYQGFACQEDTNNTIEHYLFEALSKTCLIKDRTSSNYHRCGRTDKGVSSYGQTISIDLRSITENEEEIEKELNYSNILNKVLPNDIKCIAWSPVISKFSARFDCQNRFYKYYFLKGNLNIQKMEEASKYLLGTHDFRNFCKMDVSNGVVNFTRNISKINISSYNNNNNNQDDKKETNYSFYVLNIKGTAFLWHQVRCIVAILFLVGESKEKPEIVKELLDTKNNSRKPDYNLASELPLNLFECDYYETNLNWIYDLNTLENLHQHLYKTWSENAIKEIMIKDMLDGIGKISMEKFEKSLNDSLTNEFFISGVKSRKYKPLMDRQKCKSLENRMEHFSKKRKY